MEAQTKKFGRNGVWVFVLVMIGEMAIRRLESIGPLADLDHMPSANAAADTYWHNYPRRDVIDAALSAGALLWGLAVISLAWRKYPDWSLASLLMICLSIPDVIRGAYVQAHASNLFDPARAQLSWTTYDEYHAAMWLYMRIEAPAMFLIIGILSIVGLWRLNKRTARPRKAAAPAAV